MNSYGRLARSLLLKVNPEEFEKEVMNLSREGVLDSKFREFLERCAKSEGPSPIDPQMADLLLQQILSVVFIPSSMPPHLQEYYDAKIAAVLDPPKVAAVETMLDELKEDGLLTRSFAELFRKRLQDAWQQIGGLAAEEYWEMCRERLDNEVLEEIDRLLG